MKSIAMAFRTRDGILLVVPPDLRSAAEPRLSSSYKRIGDGRWLMPPRYAALSELRRILGQNLRLDERLRAAAHELNKRGVLRKQIIGPSVGRRIGPLFASPSREVFHRPSCRWAAEIGSELLVIESAEAARALRYRPCTVCRPLDPDRSRVPPVEPQPSEDDHEMDSRRSSRPPRPTAKEQMADRFSRHRIRATAPTPTARRLGLPPVQLAGDET